MAPRLVRIAIYPVKSLDPLEVREATVLPAGGLAGDRAYAIVDAEGKWVNGKRTPRVHLLRPPADFLDQILRDRSAVEAWLSARLKLPVRLDHNPEAGFPDDTNAPGPTVITTASLREVGGWFGFGLEEARRRFRANLEIDGVPAFWEDGLIGAWFRIGDLRLYAANACARCVVPSRDSCTGDLPEPAFQRTFAERRRAALPAWADPARFDHYYRLALNTRIAPDGAGRTLRLGDEVQVSEPQP